jgi:site-specific recombinase XerD
MQAHSVDDLARSSERHLRAQNKSPRTVEAYLEAVGQFAAYLRAHRKAHGGRSLAQARGEDVEAFIIDLLGRHKPSTTTNNHYRGLHAFSRWLEDEEDLPHPMRKLKPPAVPDQPVPVVGESQLQRLLAGCAGKDFEARRDTALIMLLVDAGPRRGELVGMLLDAVDFEYDVIRVLGKGGRQRALPLGRKTSVALDRYLRVRARHKFAHLEALPLGQRGALTPVSHRWQPAQLGQS